MIANGSTGKNHQEPGQVSGTLDKAARGRSSQPARDAAVLTKSASRGHGLRQQSRRPSHADLCARQSPCGISACRGHARLHPDSSRVRPRRRAGRRSPTATVSRCSSRSSSGRTIRSCASTGSRPATSRRGQGEPMSIRQMIDRMTRDHAIDRPPRLRDRPVGGRRHDGRDAGHLPGGVRRRRHHRGPPLWRGKQCSGCASRACSRAAAASARELGRSRASGVTAPRALADSCRSGMAASTRRSRS